MTERLLVVGGDAAGMSAAATARRARPESELEIVAFERGQYTSYAACGLPFFVAGAIEDPLDLVARSPEEHRRNGLDVRLGAEVVAIDLEDQSITVRDVESNAETREPFDHLVLATGALPIRPPLPGVDASGVYGVQNLGDGVSLRDHIDAQKLDAGSHAVIVGGGYVGVEMAEALKERGIDVTVVTASPQPMATLDPDMGVLVGGAIEGLGIALHRDTMVEGFETDASGHVRAVVTSNGTIEADVVVLGIGVKPNVTLANLAGVAIGPSGGIVTDRRMATSAEGVWAAGDCVETFHRITRRPVAFPLGTHAVKQGRVVGINAAGGYAAFPGVIGTAVTRVCKYEIGRTGCSEREATEAGFEYVTAKIESSTRAGYFPGKKPITVKVLAEKRTGRLLGAQIIGREGAAKRIDVMAVAIWNEMTADEYSQLDLGYAPPFGPTWDPTLIAARKVAEAARGSSG